MDARFSGIVTKFARRSANAAAGIFRSPLPESAQELVRRPAQSGRRLARVQRVYEAERAALAAEEGIRFADAPRGVSDETWAQIRAYYDDDEIAALAWGIALLNAANRLAMTMHQRGGSCQAGMFAATVAR